MANPDGDPSHQDSGITGEFMILDKATLEI